MKRLLTIILSLCFIFALTACNPPVPVQEPQAPAESLSEWDQFVQEMADENISEGDLHTIENTGFSKKAIMEMTPEEINELLAMIRAHADQQKIDSALEILSNIEEAKSNEELVFCDGSTTARTELIDEWLEAKKNFDTATVWGVYSNEEEKFVFALACTDGMPGELFTYWMEEDIVTGRLNALEKTLITEEAYEFTDVAGNTVTIPKTPMLKYPVVELFPSNINEFEWEDYLAHMQQLKGLSERDLRSLNNMGLSRQDIMDMSDEEIQQKLEGWRKAAEEFASYDPDAVSAGIYPLADAFGFHAGQVKVFKYEILGVTEGKELTLQNTDAANAAMGLLSSKVTPQEGREMNPIVGGEFTRYTLTLLNGDVIVIEDNGMISVNEKKNLYCWEEKGEIELPEDAGWTEYTIDPFGGEENPVT